MIMDANNNSVLNQDEQKQVEQVYELMHEEHAADGQNETLCYRPYTSRFL